jgi:hypothetical protein
MDELIAVQKIAGLKKLKAMVLVMSRHLKRYHWE